VLRDPLGLDYPILHGFQDSDGLGGVDGASSKSVRIPPDATFDGHTFGSQHRPFYNSVQADESTAAAGGGRERRDTMQLSRARK